MYVVLYTSRLGIGGIQTFVLQMAKALQAYPEVKVAIFCHYPELAEADQIPEGVELWTLSKNAFLIKLINKSRNILQKLVPSFDLKEWMTKWYFFRKLRQHKQVIIHNNIQIGDAWVHQAQQELDIPYITTLHGAYKHILKEEISQQEEKELQQTLTNLLNTASNIVYLSDKNLEPFYKLLPHQTVATYPNFERIHNGLLAPKIPSLKTNSETVVFGMIARGHPDKGWLDLLEVAQELIEEGYTNFEVHLFADGEYVKGLMQKRTWASQIQYFGATTTPLQEIFAFDVGVLPTYYAQEEMPFTLIEYLACGKACIATAVGAIADMLQAPSGDLAGILLPLNPQQTVDRAALKAALLHFVQDTSRIAQYQTAVQGAFEKFDLTNTANSYYQLYKNAIEK